MNFYITNFPQFLINHKGPFITNLIKKEDKEHGDLFFHIDGYIIPRMKIFDEYKNQSQDDLLINLYRKYGEKFIRYIKGVFIIVIIHKDKFFIYNDIHSIKKVFTYNDGNYFFISDDLKTIRNHFPFAIDYENAAVFCLFSHFLNGDTIFKKIRYSEPANKIEFSDNQLKTSFYWKPNELFLEKKTNEENGFNFSIFWEKLINSYVEYIKPEHLSITLTGGIDCRMVLAPLLNRNYFLHTFSFGDPQSFDVVVAKQIAETLKLGFQNYFVNNPTKEWVLDQSGKLIDIGNTLINFHRAHRNDALEKAAASYPDTEMIFSGLMGGEYLKEPFFDDIVLPKFLNGFLINNNRGDNINFIKDQLKLKGINTENIDLNKVYEKIKSFPNSINCPDARIRKFLMTHYFYGCAHHSQDANIFNHHCKHVVNPFMDIDFLEKISSSGEWYINKKRSFFNRLFHSQLYVKTTNDLAPGLSKVPYAKRGHYTANDLINKPFVYLFKRFKYLISDNKNQYPSNFAMGEWLYQFSKEQLDKLHPDVSNIFIKDFLINKLENIRSETTEEQWHPVTNPINLSLYLKAYEKN
jgi:hypothetical protein